MVSFPPAGIACCFPDFAFHHAPVPVFVVSVQQCCFLSLLSMSYVSRYPEKSLLAAFFSFSRAMRSLKALKSCLETSAYQCYESFRAEFWDLRAQGTMMDLKFHFLQNMKFLRFYVETKIFALHGNKKSPVRDLSSGIESPLRVWNLVSLPRVKNVYSAVVPICWPIFTFCSAASLMLSSISGRSVTLPFSVSRTIVEPCRSKWPFSSPFVKM